MKCPYCSYVSFDYLNTCKKCSKDLTAHKSKYDINFLEPISLGVLSFTAAAAGAKAAAPAAAKGAVESFSHEEFMSPTSETEETHTSSVEEAMSGAMGGAEDSFGFTLEDSTGDFNLPDAEGDIEIPQKASAAAPAETHPPDEISFDSDELTLGGDEGHGAAEEAAVEEAAPEIAMEEPAEIAMEEPALEEAVPEIAMEEPAEIAMEEPVMMEEPAPEISMEEPSLEEAAPEIAMEEPAEEAAADMGAEVVSSDSGFSLGLGDDMGGLDSELDFSGIGSSGGPSGGSGSGEFEDVNLNDDDIFGGGSSGKDDDLDLELDKA